MNNTEIVVIVVSRFQASDLCDSNNSWAVRRWPDDSRPESSNEPVDVRMAGRLAADFRCRSQSLSMLMQQARHPVGAFQKAKRRDGRAIDVDIVGCEQTRCPGNVQSPLLFILFLHS